MEIAATPATVHIQEALASDRVVSVLRSGVRDWSKAGCPGCQPFQPSPRALEDWKSTACLKPLALAGNGVRRNLSSRLDSPLPSCLSLGFEP